MRGKFIFYESDLFSSSSISTLRLFYKYFFCIFNKLLAPNKISLINILFYSSTAISIAWDFNAVFTWMCVRVCGSNFAVIANNNIDGMRME